VTYVGSREAPRSFISYWHSQGYSQGAGERLPPGRNRPSSATENRRLGTTGVPAQPAGACYDQAYHEPIRPISVTASVSPSGRVGLNNKLAAMKVILLFTCCLMILACASYRELASPRIANEVVFAEFHEGGMTIGHISDPLAIANWELRVASNGAVEQRLYDESSGKWRVFEGPAIEKTELASILSDCEALPAGEPAGTPVYLGRIATDTTYLRIVSHLSAGTRDVMAFAPKMSGAEYARFLRVWKRVAHHRPVPQSPGG